MSPLEIIAVIVNVLGVWLTARRNRLCWPVNVVAVLLYAWIFFEVKLYSDMLLQVLFVALQGYGWWCWRQGRPSGPVQVGALPSREGVVGVLAAAVAGVALGSVMHYLTDAAVPWLDAQLTAFSVLASIWAARRYIASWALWIAVDVIYIGQYLYKDLTLTAGLYAGFVLLAIYGWLVWRRDMTHPLAR